MQPTDPIALGRAEAARLGVKPSMSRDRTRWYWIGPLPEPLNCIEDYRNGDTRYFECKNAAYAALGKAILSCRAAVGYDALERERDELRKQLTRTLARLLRLR